MWNFGICDLALVNVNLGSRWRPLDTLELTRRIVEGWGQRCKNFPTVVIMGGVPHQSF